MAPNFAIVVFLLSFAAGASCDVAQSGSHLRVQCSALDLGVDGMKELERKLAKSPATSMILDLQHNAIGDAGAKLIGLALSKSIDLKALWLQADGNSIGDEGARALGVALGKLHRLESVAFSARYNQIGPVGLGDLGAGLGQLRALRELTLELKFNHVSSAGLGSLGTSLARLTMLKSLKLDLYSNSVQDAGVSDLAVSLPALTGLVSLTLDLQYNRINSDGGHDLWAAVHRMTNLTSVTVALPPTPSTTDVPIAAPAQSVPTDDKELRATIESLRSDLAAVRQRQIEDGQRNQQFHAYSRQQEPFAQQPSSHQQQQHQYEPLAHHEEMAQKSTTTVIGKHSTDDAAKRKDDGVAKTGTSEDGDMESSTGGTFVVSLFAVVLLAVFILVGLQARGFNVMAVLHTANASVRDFASSFPMAAQDYSTNLPEASFVDATALEAPIVQRPNRNDSFNPDGPDLATRVDRAAARISASQRGSGPEVNFDDLISQNLNLSRREAADRME